VHRIDVRRARQMRDAVLAALPGQDAYIGAAAIADYMPAQAQPQKTRRAPTRCRSSWCARPTCSRRWPPPGAARLVVGFAAETEALERNALAKLRAKNLDLIAGNDVSAPGLGFGSEENALQVYSSDGRQDIPRGPQAGGRARAARTDRDAPGMNREVLLKILDPRLGSEFPLPDYATAHAAAWTCARCAKAP
jgi:phosphopantothenoylcysteine decarboxylase/phosphopantothenate--cysteine ligase